MTRNSIAFCIAIACGLLPGSAAAADVALIGVIGSSAAVLAVDGGEPKTVKAGQSWRGIQVISVERDRATVEIDGKRRVLTQGQHHRSGVQASSRETVTLAADRQGHFFADGTVNGEQLRFMVDTGASLITLSAADAVRMKIDYRKGRRGQLQTANGLTEAYAVRLDRVRIGGIELTRVDAVVVEQSLGNAALLGMSFLNRVQMQRDGERMTLIRRF
jgi:aspartyl protease family protein